MRKTTIVRTAALLALALAVLAAQTVLAGNFHFRNVSFQLGSLVMHGELVGLSNHRVEVILIGSGRVQAICKSATGQTALGSNPVAVSTRGAAFFMTDDAGFVSVTVSAPDPSLGNIRPLPTAEQAGCPAGLWKVGGFNARSMNWTGANVIVHDQKGVVDIDDSYACATLFVNGASARVKCLKK